MFGFIKRCFFTGLPFLSTLTSVNSLSCTSMNNQECKVRPEIVNPKRDEPVFFPFNFKTSKCSGSCNNINKPYAKLCVPDVVKNLNVKVFNLMSRTNETRHIKWHETCKCKCRLDASVCNNKQRWNDDKCWYECKELIDKGVCDKGSISNPSNCDHENCKCRKRLVDKLVEECTENIDEVEIAEITSAEDENMHKCSSYTLYIVLVSILFTINIRIGTCFIYYKYINRNIEIGAEKKF